PLLLPQPPPGTGFAVHVAFVSRYLSLLLVPRCFSELCQRRSSTSFGCRVIHPASTREELLAEMILHCSLRPGSAGSLSPPSGTRGAPRRGRSRDHVPARLSTSRP